MNEKAQSYIIQFNLQLHPEGGYFREVYRSDEILKKEFLPLRYDGDRNLATSIYFLLEGKQISKFHRLKSDEQWHFYDGCTIEIYILNEYGELSFITLGKNISSGEIFQTVIKQNQWFAAELAYKNSFCLVGCVVSPGFDFSDFELARREELLAKFSQHKELITKFTV
jgi:uncharacterized protein